MSSCYTVGFPAMTAWLGAVHAWQRQLTRIPGLEQIKLTKTAVISHQCQLQTYKNGQFSSIIDTANPLKKNKRTGNFERPPFIEEARIHLDVSLVIEAQGVSGDNEKLCKTKLQTILWQTKLASGDVVGYDENIEIKYVAENTRTERKIIHSLIPGYALVERSELLQPQDSTATDKLDSLLDFLSIHVYSKIEDEKNTRTWHYEKREPGWLVPITIGFKGISPIGKVENQRDETADHCFVESVVTLGEFRMTYRFQSLEDMMWHYEYDAANQLYLCKNEMGGIYHG